MSGCDPPPCGGTPTVAERKYALLMESAASMEHGLTANALWCAELADGLPECDGDDTAPLSAILAHDALREDSGDDLLQTAIALLQTDEPLRAHNLLDSAFSRSNDPHAPSALGVGMAGTQFDPLAGPPPCRAQQSPRAFFLMWHALWLAGEVALREQMLSKAHLLSEGRKLNPHHDTLHMVLRNAEHLGGPHSEALRRDPYVSYLHGVVLHERGQVEEAKALLIRGVLANPLLWCAWEALARYGAEVEDEVLAAAAEAEALGGGPTHRCFAWMFDLFRAELHLKNFADDSHALYESLRGSYPTASNILGKCATAAYQQEKLPEAKQLFLSLQELDRYCLHGVSVFSNVLYLQEDIAPLAQLSHRVYNIDPYRAEVQCALGNHYSRQRQGDRAIHHFHRALQLDRRCHSAWTYLGHEYSPDQGNVGNTKASIFCYTKAVECEPRDYRAWLGLAQVYITQVSYPMLARLYAEKSLALKPTDARLAACVQDLRTKAQPYTDTPAGMMLETPSTEDASSMG